MIENLWLPAAYLKRVLPAGFFKERLLGKKFSIKRTFLRALVTAAELDEQELKDSYARTIKFYREKEKKLEDEEVKNPEKKAVNNEKLLKSRVENLVVYSESQRLKDEHKGEYYIWLPSSSKEPRPQHQLLYGEIRKVGDGEFPNEDYGCKCGAYFLGENPLENDFLTDEQKNKLEKLIKKDKTKEVNSSLTKILKEKKHGRRKGR
nr:MAG TPA: hypothetical protein [Caudoviricetes sp.]